MKHVRKSVLLWYGAREMYDLVVGVERYPQFLLWCDSAQVIARHDDGVTARLGLSYAGLKHAFTTRNRHVPFESVVITLVDGPFSVLDGAWQFKPIVRGNAGGVVVGGEGGSGEGGLAACRVEFELRYAFASKALELVISPVFDRIATTFVDSFVTRAEQVYGKR